MRPEDIDPSMSTLFERFDSVLYPFPIERVLEALPAQGWIVPYAERDESGVKLLSAPSKGNIRLVFDINLRTLGVRGTEPKGTLDEFQAVSSFVATKFGLAPEVHSFYTEFRFVGSADVGAEPKVPVPERLTAWWAGHERSDELTATIAKWLPGDELGAYGVRIATKSRDANRPDWAELTIGPSVTSGSRFYSFDLLYRSRNRRTVELVASNAFDVVMAAVEELER